MADQTYTVVYDGETSVDDNPKPLPTELAIGIDIGTSKCTVAIWNGSRVELLRNTRNQKLIRSCVLFRDEIPSGGVSTEVPHGDSEILSGSAVFNMKRLIGRIDTDPVVNASKTLPFMVQTLGIGVRPFIAALVNNVWRSVTPEEVLAIFLLELKAMAELQLKRPIRNAVLTIPVAFSRFQLTRIERACAMAGINVFRLMPEPTAVALLYAQQQQQTMHENMGSGIEKVALIFSMGAGYCDIAITATAGGVSQIKALLGIPLGGEDILQNILRYVLPDFDSLCSNNSLEMINSMAMLRIAAQNAIHKLSSQTSVEINVDLGDGNKISRSLTRAEFEEANHEVFVKCEKLIAQCLLDAKLTAEDLVDVILVGGCSSIPKIRSLVLGLCKKGDSYKGIDPLEAAVCGAAMEGAIASGASDPSGSLDLLTIQATPMSLGILLDGDCFAPVIHRNTPVPARKEMLFTTTHDNQSEALIVVYEGESKKAEENNLLGYFKITGIPSAPKGSAEICVCMDIDASNNLRVYAGAFLLGTKKAVSPFLEVRMPTVDDGHGWCGQALVRMYGATMDLTSIPKKV
ncbi:heat shock 70 kDa protein 8-like [Phalaenopsis equestris]|uniref:heat shock 70 kDa protein 8-like n=1 Tax=Phalaenopsis equestris TaxID=78828 RepID=UPI0009E22CBC|nr:heat shock 70 kDa protein 8-like [Phalaenopsis equestris]XP_020580251.1 heat shock 70 kDa protein 8-like [Phalaenopsis equestris]XP_020597299.1 heat shock 70 kDa protein 8-like [Phalaenopsis equestris]